MRLPDQPASHGSLVRAGQPWGDAILARLYDAFPFDADVPLYLELASAQGGRVLEVACGTGRVLVPLAQAGFSVTGLDASNKQFQKVKVLEQKIGVPVLGFDGRFGMTGATGGAHAQVDVGHTIIAVPMIP